jgi:hypothetical protein
MEKLQHLQVMELLHLRMELELTLRLINLVELQWIQQAMCMLQIKVIIVFVK